MLWIVLITLFLSNLLHCEAQLLLRHSEAKNNSVSTHERNLQLLMTEIFKTKSKLNPDFVTDIFKESSVSYKLQKGPDTLLSVVRTTSYAIETVSFIGKKLWQTCRHH